MALTALIGFSVLFALTHILLSHGRLRESLVGKMGEWGFRGFYSAVSILTLGGAIFVLAGHRDLGPKLWDPPWFLHPITALLMLFAFLLLFLAFANPSPAGMVPAAVEARGVLRITRHPMNMAIAAFALAHLLVNPYLGELFFFGSLFVVGFLGPYHQDRRKTREKGENWRAFQEQTSIFPFAALVRGKTKLVWSEFSLLLVFAAIAAFTAMLFLHGKLIGKALF